MLKRKLSEIQDGGIHSRHALQCYTNISALRGLLVLRAVVLQLLAKSGKGILHLTKALPMRKLLGEQNSSILFSKYFKPERKELYFCSYFIRAVYFA